MTNQLKLLITESAANLVTELDGKILISSKRIVAEKLLEKFANDIVSLDDQSNQPKTS